VDRLGRNTLHILETVQGSAPGDLLTLTLGFCCFKTFKVRNRVLRLIPNMVVNSLTGSPCW
jgi:hypothetical protein